MPLKTLGSSSVPLKAAISPSLVNSEAAEKLKHIVRDLNDFTGSTEEEFLRLGASLQEFLQRSDVITSIAADLVTLVSGEDIANGISRLERIVERMDYFLKNALAKNRHSIATLERLLAVLVDLDDPLAGFRKINKVLRMLGISTRIESTRLEDGGEGFDNLATDVQQLYLQINEKAASVNDLKKHLSSMILQTIERIMAIESEQRAQVGNTLEKASSSLGLLAESNRKCGEFASSISNASGEVSGNISEVVMSMQFHDITRQQIEHAADGLAYITAKAAEISTSASGETEPSAFADEFLAVSELQRAQLAHASSELTAAVDNIMANLRGIAAMEGAISLEAREMAGTAEGVSFFYELEGNLSLVADALKRGSDEDRSLVDALGKVDGTIEEISLFVSAIETIGEEIELIAINAQIKAARTGEFGAALCVLAEEIQRLSREARVETMSISGMLNGITDLSGELCRDMEGESVALECEVKEITMTLGDMMAMFNRLNGDFAATLERIDLAVKSLNGDIVKEIAGITVQRKSEEVLGGAMDDLAAVAAFFHPLAGSSEVARKSMALAGMSDRYTMKSERKIHESLGASKNRAAPDISPGRAASIGPEDGLGENVELF